ncbi:MAG: ABC transporter permease [Pirellulaceae bacterium]
MFHATAEVIRFESHRTRTRSRLMIWLALAGFPSLLMILLQSQAQGRIPDEVLALTTYYLVVQIGCMLGLLLWATPAVGSELEAQTWIYLAMRPAGKIAVLLGKFIVAAVWTASAGLVSAIGVSFASQYSEPYLLARTLILLVLLASVCYSALYIMIGIAFTNRATVLAVIYTLLFEGVLSMVPATINKFTVCFRLRALLADWCNLARIRSESEALFGYEPAWQHLVCLVLYAVVVMVAALWVMQTKEFPVNSE